MRYQIYAITFGVLITTTNAVFSEPQIVTDDDGNIVMAIQDNGNVIRYTYDENGRRIVNDNSSGEKIEFDATGKTYSE